MKVTSIVHYIKRFVNGKWLDGSLHGVLHIPELRTNLFSIGNRLIKVLLQPITKTSVKWSFMKGKETCFSQVLAEVKAYTSSTFMSQEIIPPPNQVPAIDSECLVTVTEQCSSVA